MNMNQDEALSNYNDYNDLLQSEVYVDLERLRILARHGIPNELRGVSNSSFPFFSSFFVFFNAYSQNIRQTEREREIKRSVTATATVTTTAK